MAHSQIPPSLGLNEPRIELITNADDFEPAFDSICNAFGHQTADAIWIGMHPLWDTPDGKSKGAARMADRWRSSREAGNTLFLKATFPDPNDGNRDRIVGLAIWVQASLVPGCGEAPGDMGLAALYPDDEREQRYLQQALGSLHKRRLETLHEKARPESVQKSAMVLDLCGVDPAFQGKGIAKKLVQWGLDEAQRRGDIEAITEASVMGRRVYTRMGFREVEEIEYHVDDEFKGRSLPSNVFLRTKPPG
jgi:GNAT superfamily N-acetyltransferase